MEHALVRVAVASYVFVLEGLPAERHTGLPALMLVGLPAGLPAELLAGLPAELFVALPVPVQVIVCIDGYRRWSSCTCISEWFERSL